MSEPSLNSGPEPAEAGGRFGSARRRRALVGAGLAAAVVAIGWFVARPLLSGSAAPAAAATTLPTHHVRPSASATPVPAAPGSGDGSGAPAGTDPFAALYVPPTSTPGPTSLPTVPVSPVPPVPSVPVPSPTAPAPSHSSAPAPKPSPSPSHTRPPSPAPSTPASHAVELLSVSGTGSSQQWTITVDGTPFTVRLGQSFDHGFVVFRYSGDVPTLRYGNEAFDLPLGVIYHT